MNESGRESRWDFRELEEWLTTATHGVGGEAADRFAAEIEQHFLDEREALRRRGWSEDDVERQALAALGNPNRARRALRRSHLNSWEKEKLHRMSQKPAKHLVIFRWLVSPIFLTLFWITARDQEERDFLIVVFSFLLLAWLMFRGAKQLWGIRGKLVFWALAHSIWVGFSALVCLGAFGVGEWFGSFLWGGIAVFFLVRIIRLLSLARKLPAALQPLAEK